MSSNAPKPFGVSSLQAKKMSDLVLAIEETARNFQNLTDDEILAKSSLIKNELKKELSAKEKRSLQIETFALSFEAVKRETGLTLHSVQLLGGLIVAQGAIAEMATGEGKTLTAVAPVAWWALHGKGVHVATANDYLASRDAQTLRPIYKRLGLSVKFTNRTEPLDERKEAYRADITYATAQTLGFDYLTDNLAHSKNETVLRDEGFFAAIVDEADSLLIDEARTPLIISAPNPAMKTDWRPYALFVKTLSEEDFEINKSEDYIVLTTSGTQKAEEAFSRENIYDDPVLVQRVLTALRAEFMLERNKDYIVKSDKVMIVDSNTGRVLEGRRFQDGIHEALEAKEGFESETPTVTMASVTLQSFFGSYQHLGGMTGTALTDADELTATYGTQVLGVPTHRPRRRIDHGDFLFPNEEAKYKALVEEIKERNLKGQPVLIGTSSVEESEKLSSLLLQEGLLHNVLNARSSEKEAEIISQAGRKGAITISTSMAGRGVDIKLGGEPSREETHAEKDLRENEKNNLYELGGLVVLSTSKALSQRVDNQLKGRSGRQGEPGETRFYLAADDDLITVFGGNQVSSLIRMLPSSEGALNHKGLSRMLEKSQKRVEGMHADSRRSLIEFDGVYTAQRKAFYSLRKTILNSSFEEISSVFLKTAYLSLLNEIDKERSFTKRETKEMRNILSKFYPLEVPEALFNPKISLADKASLLAQGASGNLKERFAPLDAADDPEALKGDVVRKILLDMIDQGWTRLLGQVEDIQKSISLRRYAQVDPKIAFAQEAKTLYIDFLNKFYRTALYTFWRTNMSLGEKKEEQKDKLTDTETLSETSPEDETSTESK